MKNLDRVSTQVEIVVGGCYRLHGSMALAGVEEGLVSVKQVIQVADIEQVGSGVLRDRMEEHLQSMDTKEDEVVELTFIGYTNGSSDELDYMELETFIDHSTVY